MKNKLISLILVLFVLDAYAQNITGVVLDFKTKEPIESASVYFDNTTIGTATNSKGEFEIKNNKAVNSPLIISYLGFKKVTLPSYSSGKFYKVLLEEDENTLDEVVIHADDGMSRAYKLKAFRRQFLGYSENASSCTIINESDLNLRYNKRTGQLVASSRRPLEIENVNLDYKIVYEIKDFIIQYYNPRGYSNPERFSVKSMIYTGTSFYEEIKAKDTKIEKRREKTYKGSVLHFMRAMSSETLVQNGYQIFVQGYAVEPDRYISVMQTPESEVVKVKLRLPFSVLYAGKKQSELLKRPEHKPSRHSGYIKTQALNDTISLKKNAVEPYFNTLISIDKFGNHSSINAFYFNGYMATMRIADTLPLDYNLEE